MLLVHGLRLPPAAPATQAVALAAKRCKLGAATAGKIHKVSVDARHGKVSLVYSVAFSLEAAAEAQIAARLGPNGQCIQNAPLTIKPGTAPLPGPVLVCGLGPAGLFAALELARAGYAPLVLERGPAMPARRRAVEAFEAGGELDEAANIQFGEGGAGTFSDGKLTTRIKDPLCHRVIGALLAAGAPEEIAWRSRPHIGTDLLQGVFVRLREEVEALGGKVLFNTRLSGLQAQSGRLCAISTPEGSLPCGALVLAVGHSARDTFTAVHEAGVQLEAKPFSVGLRIEHLQRDIDQGLYHGLAGHPALPPGEYQLSTRVEGRGVYTFCMCPGGAVVAAASEAGGLVTNGMSLHARSGPNANAALVAGVGPQDFGAGPFAGVQFQRRLEQAAFRAGGGGFAAPAESLGSFLEDRGALVPGSVRPTYPRGVNPAQLGALFPAGIATALRGGIKAFGKKLPGFDACDAVLTGVETRTSSPVRMPRGDGLESLQLQGLWPCGEGAGYAGGIVSAAVDGIRVAHAIIARYAPVL